MKVRRKGTFEALQFDPDTPLPSMVVAQEIDGTTLHYVKGPYGSLQFVRRGAWIIEHRDGGHYPVTDAIFLEEYEEV